jgi:hypothetical protein
MGSNKEEAGPSNKVFFICIPSRFFSDSEFSGAFPFLIFMMGAKAGTGAVEIIVVVVRVLIKFRRELGRYVMF